MSSIEAASALALRGGAPVVPPGTIEERWPLVAEEDVQAVADTLRTGKLSWINDEAVPALESAWAGYIGTRYCLALNSGTAALHAAVAAAGVEPGDEVIVPALTFLASASAVIHHQGIPVFVDVDPETFTLDPAKLEEKISERTRAVVVVHLHGLPADMDPIREIARRRGIYVIEDTCQAPGALYHGKKAGSLGDMSAYSIMAGKNLPTAGEGGLFTTDDPDLRDRADMIKMFGERIRPGEEREYNAITMGWNYRFSSILAAFTLSQLRRLDDYTARVQEGAEYLAAGLREIPGLVPPKVPEGRTHVYHHFRFRVDPEAAGMDVPAGRLRKALQDLMEAEGVPLIEYQNRPIPGQFLFQQRVGYGKAAPGPAATPAARSLTGSRTTRRPWTSSRARSWSAIACAWRASSSGRTSISISPPSGRSSRIRTSSSTTPGASTTRSPGSRRRGSGDRVSRSSPKEVPVVLNETSPRAAESRFDGLREIAHRLRHHVVHMAADSPGAHVGGSMSAIEILTVLFFDGVLNVDPQRPKMEGRDYLIFSKGHASAALYGALAERGFFPVEELKTYKQMGSRLAGHSLKSIPGVELATGSLGHGLAVGNGLALAGKYDKSSYRVFVVLGDGECQEGAVWEAAMAAAHYKLDNLVAIVDRNGVQEDGPTEEIMALEPFADKWRAFNWAVEEVDGHDVESLSGALHKVPFTPGRPSLVLARTVKGKGVTFAEHKNAWHYGKLSGEQREQALADLAAAAPVRGGRS